jgi:hypothetical protein
MKKISSLFVLLIFTLSYSAIAEVNNRSLNPLGEEQLLCVSNGGYGIQWQKNFGSDWRGGRFEGPQPIGDCDGDGDNEVLIGGRDDTLRVMEWNEEKKTYEETSSLHSPFYYLFLLHQMIDPDAHGPPDAGGFAIGDLTGDGKNEIAATWYTTVYTWIGGKYRIIGFNPWIFWNQGGNGDCYIGDYDSDGQNELIMSGGPQAQDSPVPQIVIFKWNGLGLVKVAEWADPRGPAYVFMAGMGDTDQDGENEIVCGSVSGVVVLDWNKETESFESTIVKTITSWDEYPFACVCKDSDMDGKVEIHVGYHSPQISIFEWNGTDYEVKFETEWPGEEPVIEALDVGDVDDDDSAEVCVGTNVVHILQWNGSTYVEEALLDQTYGLLAVLNIGDCDNDGKNEINIAPVFVDQGQDYIYWIFKYGWQSQ